MDKSLVTGVFLPAMTIKDALETLLGWIMVILAGKYGGKSPKLTWYGFASDIICTLCRTQQIIRQDIELHSHYSATIHSSIDFIDKNKLVLELMQCFKDNRLVSKAKIAAKSIEVRFVCNQSAVSHRFWNQLHYLIISTDCI